MRKYLLTGMAVLAVVPAVAEAASDEPSPYTASSNAGDRERALTCLTEAVYYEARNQSDDGQRAVAQVVLNRVRHPSFPNRVCGVVYQGSSRITGCQFSFTCDGSMNRGIDPYAWDRAQRIASAALGGSVYRPVGLALNYHTTAIHPYWAPSLTPQTIVGAHIFYRRPGWNGSGDAFTQTPGDEPEPGARIDYSTPRYIAPSNFGVRSGRYSRGARANYEVAVEEIPVVEQAVYERPVRMRASGGARGAVRASASRSDLAAAPASAVSLPRVQEAAYRAPPRVVMQNGVRVFRGH